MKKFTLLAAAAAVGLSVAGAQTWETRGDNTYTLKSCYPSSGAIRCDFTFTHTTDTPGLLNIGPSSFEVVTSDGWSMKPSRIAAGGSGLTQGGFQIKAYKGAPLQVSMVFDVPTTTTSFPVLVLESVPINNIRVNGAAPPPPATGTTPASSTAYTAVLSNCKTDVKGIMTCTAVLTPRK